MGIFRNIVFTANIKVTWIQIALSKKRDEDQKRRREAATEKRLKIQRTMAIKKVNKINRKARM